MLLIAQRNFKCKCQGSHEVKKLSCIWKRICKHAVSQLLAYRTLLTEEEVYFSYSRVQPFFPRTCYNYNYCFQSKVTEKVFHVTLSLMLHRSFFSRAQTTILFLQLTDMIFFISTLLLQNWAGTEAFDSSALLSSSLVLGSLPFLFYTRVAEIHPTLFFSAGTTESEL